MRTVRTIAHAGLYAQVVWWRPIDPVRLKVWSPPSVAHTRSVIQRYVGAYNRHDLSGVMAEVAGLPSFATRA
jgi:hypothetical protein